MLPHTRRGILRVCGWALVATVAGCVSDGSPADTTEPTDRTAPATDLETPPPGECDPRDPPSPEPTDEGLEPRSYPTYPEVITEETAVSFAEDYEHAYRQNTFVEKNANTGYDELQVQLGAELVDKRSAGYVVRVDGELLFADEEHPETATATPYPSGTMPFGAWYLLADRFALRKGVDGGLPENADPDFAGAEVVVCDG